MASAQPARSRRRLGLATIVVLLALLVLLLAVAAPATAASAKVVSGDARLTIPKAQVAALTAKSIAVLPVSPASFGFQWNNAVTWWFKLPMAGGGTFDYTAKKGAFSHSGALRFVNVATDQSLLMGGLRVIVISSHAITLSSAIGTAPATRAVVFTATNSPRFTKRGKAMRIDGIQFKLTDAGALAIKLALGVDLSTTALFLDADLQFKIK